MLRKTCACLLVLAVGLASAQTAKPWTPPSTTIPKEFVDATAFLLSHGMADPRGGQTFEATVPFGAAKSLALSPVSILGWRISPAANRFVGSDGLLHTPVTMSGPRPDADIFAIPQGLYGFPDPQLPVALLLIRGDVGLAEFGYSKARLLPGGSHAFIRLANEYLANRFRRAVAAHMRGDDALALADARALQAVRDDFEREGIRVIGEVEWKRIQENRDVSPADRKIFPYLAPIDALAEDSARRLREGSPPPLDLVALSRRPPRERIETLVRNLDQVEVQQMMQPGGVILPDDPIVAALIKEGEPAMEPLLDVMERDHRLTRSVSFGRDFWPGRNLITVQRAALAAFREIAGVYQVPLGNGEQIDVKGLRAFWHAHRGMSQPDRWLRILADDTAGQMRWMEAAQRLLDPIDVRRIGSGGTVTLAREPGSPLPPMKAEALRDRKAPSLSDLLARRARELAMVDSPKPEPGTFELSYSLRIALLLHRWDPNASLPTLQALSRHVMKMIGRPNHGHGLAGVEGASLAEVVETRWQMGDRAALTEWAMWVVGVDEGSGGSELAKGLQPFLNHRDDPVIRRATDQFFRGLTSKWNLAQMARARPGWNHAESVVVTPLLILPAVRAAVNEILTDETVIGEIVAEDGQVMLRMKNNNSVIAPAADPLFPKPGDRLPYRVADNMATALSHEFKGAPPFAIYWPIKERDVAIAKLRAYLREGR